VLIALLTRLRRERRGFTLVETLVAMVTGLVVTGALFAILEVSLHQSSRLSDVAQATQLGRATMTHMVDEMHSACISEKFIPVQETSTPNKLVLLNGYSESAEVPVVATSTTGVRKDEVEYVSSNSTVLDKTWLATAETSSGVFSFQATPKETRIGENISQIEEAEAPKVKLLFRYFEFAQTANGTTSESSNALARIPLKTETEKLGASAKKVVAVEAAFVSAPSDKSTKLGRTATLNSLVTFSFSAPDSEATITGGPCE
jgi:Tfp pilus assembly protein PilW